jgi:hypothetical protein
LEITGRSLEFLKEHRKVEQLQRQIEALAAGLQNVSAELDLRKSGPQTVCLPAASSRTHSE